MSSSDSDVQKYRSAYMNVLGLLASLPQQCDYERNVPIADVRAELICAWFDDLYHPTSDLFLSAFSACEALRLAEFNDFYAFRLDRIPNRLAEMHQSSAWLEVVGEAKAVLRDLGW